MNLSDRLTCPFDNPQEIVNRPLGVLELHLGLKHEPKHNAWRIKHGLPGDMSLRTIHTWRRDIRIAILGDWAIFKPTKKRVLKDNAANSIAIVSSADDDSWVNEKWNEATSSIGDSLKCAMCHKPASELRVDVCYDCFRIWALSCKPKKKTKQS